MKPDRLHQLQSLLREKKLPAVLVSTPHHVRYLSGYIGTNGRLLVAPDQAVLITDFRYLRSARKQIPKRVKLFDQKDDVKNLFSRYEALGFEEETVTQGQYKRLRKALPGVRLKPVSGMMEDLRLIKEEGEIEILRKAARMTDQALTELLRTLHVGISENELEWNLLSIARKLGADGFSFPPILCFGKNTADVHHIKEPNRLKKGEAVLIDMGLEYQGYMTDMTRTFYTQKPSAIEQKIYSLVAEANQAAIDAIEVGRPLKEIDAVARKVIEKAGYGDRFGHSTGHGVGMEVHEAPTVSAHSKALVKPGMVFTIEPGIYLDEIGGVRIEDMVYVRKDGKVEVLTNFERGLTILSI